MSMTERRYVVMYKNEQRRFKTDKLSSFQTWSLDCYNITVLVKRYHLYISKRSKLNSELLIYETIIKRI